MPPAKRAAKAPAKRKAAAPKTKAAPVGASTGGRGARVLLQGVDAWVVITSFRASAATTSLRDGPAGEADPNYPQTIVDDLDDYSIDDLVKAKSARACNFLDSRRKNVKLWVHMAREAGGPLPIHTQIPCFWCRHQFASSPIGCPIAHFRGMDAAARQRFEDWATEHGLQCGLDAGTYETEGVFCSFSCCKAYILSQRGRVKYASSLSLLAAMYVKLFDRVPDYPTAPSWKFTDTYGGHLTIDEYRAALGRLEYSETPNVRRPYLFSTPSYYAERLAA